jgi:hypothetical protein
MPDLWRGNGMPVLFMLIDVNLLKCIGLPKLFGFRAGNQWNQFQSGFALYF